MPTYFRRDDYVQNGIGYAVPNIAVTYYVEPGLTLATIYEDENGVTVASNPQFTDGLGHAYAYMATGLYTITYSGSTIQTLTLPDQPIGGISGVGSTITTFAGNLQGTIDGVNRVFTITNGGTPLTIAPTQVTVWDNFPLANGTGYTVSGVTVVFAAAPQPGDTVYSQGFTVS